MGLNECTKLAQPSLSLNLSDVTNSSPSPCFMGKPSVTKAAASSVIPRSPTPFKEVTDCQVELPLSFDGLIVGQKEAGGCNLDGLAFDGLVVHRKSQMVVRHAPMELDCSPFDGFYSGGHLMSPSVMDRAGISSDGYEKFASHF